MGCNMEEGLLQEYLEGLLGPLEEAIVEEHLKNCESCRREETSMKLLLWDLDSLKDMDFPIDAAEAGRKALNEFESSERLKARSTADIAKKQLEVIKTSGVFLNYVPGFKKGETLVKKGVKKMPSLILKGTRGAVSRTMRLMIARVRA